MLRYIKHHLASEQGVECYGMFSLLIFVLFFIFVLIRITKMKKSTIEELGQLPFSTEDINNQKENL
jgi:tellurite resistance protein TehA-like permease